MRRERSRERKHRERERERREKRQIIKEGRERDWERGRVERGELGSRD